MRLPKGIPKTVNRLAQRFRGNPARKPSMRMFASSRASSAAPRPWSFEKENPRILVPSGSFEMGSNKGKSDEQPIKTIHLSAYHLAKTPITVGQYRRFLEESQGVQLRAVLSGEGKTLASEGILANPGEAKDALAARAREVIGSRIEILQEALGSLPDFA